MSQYTILNFDTDLFGFGVAKILPSHLTFAELQDILNELRTQKIKLVYWLTDSADVATNQTALTLNGFLADKKVTYLTDLNLVTKNIAENTPLLAQVEPYTANLASAELEQLALQAGTYSHFRADPNFPEKLFIKLYKTWIANSVNKTIATAVLVVQRENTLAGMITLGEKNQRGDIGLLAVNANYRGQNIGTALVYAAQQYFLNAGFTHSQVVTQLVNQPACHLYEKCGYTVEKIEHFYHFWL